MRRIFDQRDKTGSRAHFARRSACAREEPRLGAAMERRQDALNRTSALDSVGGDLEYLREVIGIVQAALPNLLAMLRQAVAGKDIQSIRKTARLLRAAAHSVSAGSARAAAIALETAAARGEEDVLAAQAAALEAEIARLEPALAELERSISPDDLPGGCEVPC